MLLIRRVPENEYSNAIVAEVQFYDADGVIPPNATFPQFALNTYECLRTTVDQHGVDNGEHVYALVNKFFETLPIDVQKNMFDYYCQMSDLLRSIDSNNIGQIRKGPMTDITTQVLMGNDIPRRAIDFIDRSDIPFPAIPDEMRDHDTDEMTFRRPEYVDLTAVSLLSKIMSPIWGQLIYILKTPMVNEFDKEVNCYLIIIDVLRTGPFGYIYTRFSSYLKKAVNKALSSTDPTGRKGSNTFSLAGNGFVIARLQEMVYAITLVKKFVIHDVWKLPSGGTEPPNIMTYAWDVLIKTARSKISNMRDRAQFLVRFELSDSSAGTADNTTLLDHSSRSSSTPFDYPEIIRAGAALEFDRFIEECKFPKRAVQQALRFHAVDNVVRPNILNQGIGASIFGRRIGVSDLRRDLTKDLYTKMTVLSQFYLAALGLHPLVPFLTCASDDAVKPGPSDTLTARTLHHMKTSRPYKECSEYFPATPMSEPIPEYRREEVGMRVTSENVGIQAQIGRIQSWICSYQHTYNVSPAVWAALGVEESLIPMHEETMTHREDIMSYFCQFLLYQHRDIYRMDENGNTINS